MEPVRVTIQTKDFTFIEKRLSNDEAVKIIDDLIVEVNMKKESIFNIHGEDYVSTDLMGINFEEVYFHGKLGTFGISFESM